MCGYCYAHLQKYLLIRAGFRLLEAASLFWVHGLHTDKPKEAAASLAAGLPKQSTGLQEVVLCL